MIVLLEVRGPASTVSLTGSLILSTRVSKYNKTQTVVVTVKQLYHTSPFAIYASAALICVTWHICSLTNSRSRLESSKWFYRKLEITLYRGRTVRPNYEPFSR